MNPLTEMRAEVAPFVATYDARGQDRVWAEHSLKLREFWRNRIMASGQEVISDEDCDPIIRILDRNAKGNTKESQSVARAMVPQGAWRRMFNQLHTDRPLGRALDAVLTQTVPELKAKAVDELYRLNQGERNYLTGSSGNAVCAFLAAYDPVTNTSVISLKDRRVLLDYLGAEPMCAWDTDTVGAQIVQTNEAILIAARELGLIGSARTISRFFYAHAVKPLWRGEHTVQLPGGSVSVAVPTDSEDDALAEESGTTAARAGTDVAVVASVESPANDEVRESMQIQALLARIGTQMGFTIWLPKADRSRVLKLWTPQPGELLEVLPLGYDATTTKTIEQIDVLWLRRRSIARAFEVEHTTSIYSGLLRMADLVALQPDINVRLHIVASVDRQTKVLQEINRPIFAMLERRPLREMCTFLSYDHIREIADLKHLGRVSDLVLEDYEITADAGNEL